jgi:hypothetical protein
MTRRLLAATLALVLAGSALALAAAPKTGRYQAGKGQVQRGYDLAFTVDRGGRRISHLVAHVLETCAGESTSSTTTVGPGLTWTVKGGRFSGRKKETSGDLTLYTTLEGSFSGRTAKGTLRQESIVAGARCDTYKLKFTAARR